MTLTILEQLSEAEAAAQAFGLAINGTVCTALRRATAEIERLEGELKEVESRRDLAIANYVRTLAERDALTDRLIRAGLKS